MGIQRKRVMKNGYIELPKDLITKTIMILRIIETINKINAIREFLLVVGVSSSSDNHVHPLVILRRSPNMRRKSSSI